MESMTCKLENNFNRFFFNVNLATTLKLMYSITRRIVVKNVQWQQLLTGNTVSLN